MKLHFLGGADEVGASCLLVEAGDCRILVDAGVRMGGGCKDRLPDLARATDLGGLDAVLVTHAHLDHSGALPLVHGAFPRAEVLTSEPTVSLLRVLLLDAVKIMEQKAEREDEIPLYPLPAVESLLACVRPVRFLEPVRICSGRAAATFFPAGHVLGAAAVGLDTPEGRVLVTGDVSVTPQLTVPGMPVPRFAPDLLVCESTYGARLHASRRAEEQRLVDAVFSALREGRQVLIPAFALGRAQEVLLILRRALAQADSPPAVVWADGMVRAVCDIYGRHPAYLAPALRRRAEAEREPFYTADGRIRPVREPAEREAVLAGPPCVIVASSGMLSGGPSSLYAARLAARQDALIAITGYQDEEAPGRRLQEAALGKSAEIFVNGQAVKVACRVETYGLSAHADSRELAGLVSALEPGSVALVHGDAEARAGLARILSDAGCDVSLPLAGESLEVQAVKRKAERRLPALGRGRPLDREGLLALRDELLEQHGTRRSFSPRELAELWYGSRGLPEDLAPVHKLLAAAGCFEPDARRPFCFRPVDPATGKADPVQDGSGRLEQNAALAEIDRRLGPESGLYRRGAERESWTLRLYFHFPGVARERHADAIEALARATGWSVALHPETHLGALEQRLRQGLPGGCELARAPSVFNDTRRVKAVVDRIPDDAQGICAAFEAETGFALSLEPGGAGTPAARKAFDERGRMEINLAFRAIEEAFSGLDARPGKKSKKSDAEGPLLEIAFTSPELAGPHREMIGRLEQETGWRIRVAERVDQQAVLRIAAELIPGSWQLARSPGLDVAGRKVLLKPSAPIPAAELDEVSQELVRRTGFGLQTR
ncbi:MAG: MBL fold metallo-hydrolase [Deltaproteobacteria bacterium]|nr:MBL fold metallo-hydrolase [Deltaproteobacteria bacterium]